MDYRKLAEEVPEKAGGRENIISAARCAGGLRLALKDEKPVNKKEPEETEGYNQVFSIFGYRDEVEK